MDQGISKFVFTKWVTCALLLMCCSSIIASAHEIVYENKVGIIRGKLLMQWKVVIDQLCIRLSAGANEVLDQNGIGWMGFGIAELTSGGMAGADIVVASFSSSDSVPEIKDMYAVAESSPIEDISNDWIYHGYDVNEENITVDMCRNLITNDPQDRNIVSLSGSSTELFSVVNAMGKGTFSFHGENREAHQIPLLGSQQDVEESANVFDKLDRDPTTIKVTLRPGGSLLSLLLYNSDGQTDVDSNVNGTVIPSGKTSYVNYYWKLGNLTSITAGERWHIVAMKPQLEDASGAYIHHFVLAIEGALAWAWAGGNTGMVFPDHVGYPVSKDDLVELQTHLDNPGGRATGLRDNSGVVLYLKKDLVGHDAGVLQLGDGLVSMLGQALPAHKSEYSFVCPSACLTSEMQVFSILYHQHANGIAVFNEHRDRLGNLKTNPVFAGAEYYDWEIQRNFAVNFTVSPGDSITTTCVYDTQNRQDVVFGLASEEEMCIMFLYYYPARPGSDLQFCGTTAPYAEAVSCSLEAVAVNLLDDAASFRDFPGQVSANGSSSPSSVPSSSSDSGPSWSPMFAYENNVSTTQEKLLLEWKATREELCVQLSAAASDALEHGNGWLGFGLGEPTSGGMAGADVVVVSFTQGSHPRVEDMYTVAEAHPIKDAASNDWTMISYEINEQLVRVEMCRNLVTGDGQDRDIVALTGASTEMFNVITAMGKGGLSYHGQVNRQALQIPLLASKEEVRTELDAFEALERDTSVTTVVLKHGNAHRVELVYNSNGLNQTSHLDPNENGTTIPPGKTSYVDYTWDIASLLGIAAGETWHLVAAAPIIEEAAKRYLHHFVLSYASGYSYTMVWGWAHGNEGIVFPENVGLPIASGHLVLNSHFDNPGGVSTGVRDDSGLKLYLKKGFKGFDAGILQLGDGAVTLRNPLPEGKSVVSFTCPSRCFSFPGPKHVFSLAYHQHAAGIAVFNEHRDSSGRLKTNPLFAASEYFDWEIQRSIRANFTISPGDSIKTTCLYDTHNTDADNSDTHISDSGTVSTGSKNTRFGLGSEDEMCIVFLYYYPAEPLFPYCGAVPEFNGAKFGCEGDVATIAPLDDSLVFRTFPQPSGASTPTAQPPSASTHTPSSGFLAGVAIACFTGLGVLILLLVHLGYCCASPSAKNPAIQDDVEPQDKPENCSKPENEIAFA